MTGKLDQEALSEPALVSEAPDLLRVALHRITISIHNIDCTGQIPAR